VGARTDDSHPLSGRLSGRLAWVVALAGTAVSLPFPSVRVGSLSLAAALVLAVAPGSRVGRFVVAVVTALTLHEGIWRGSPFFGAVALVGAVLFVRSVGDPFGTLDRAAVGAGIAAAVLTSFLPGLDWHTCLNGTLAGLAAGVAVPAGWRFGVAAAQPRWLAVPFAMIAGACAWLGLSWERGQGQSAAEQLRRSDALGLSSIALLDRRRIANDPASPADSRLDAWREVFVRGGGRAAWIERVALLRRLNRSEAGPETHRLILSESWGFDRPTLLDSSESALDPQDDFAGRLFLVSGRYVEAAGLFRRWAARGGGDTARLLEARADILDGRNEEARTVLDTLPVAEPGVACARVDAGDRTHALASLCIASRPFHRVALEILGDTDRLAEISATDPVADEFGGALRLVGTRLKSKPGAFYVSLAFEGLAPLLDPARVEVEVRGPATATVVANDVEMAPSPGDRVPVSFEVRAPVAGAYLVKVRVQSPWGPWMRTRKGQVATDWPFPVGTAVVP
jgi:hypothetical protein